eukprot:SM001524S01443  [mRNA]  locus=s1524:105:1487:- [translate_table: standard]
MRSPSLFRVSSLGGVMGARLWGSGGGSSSGGMTAPMLVLYLAAILGILSLLTQVGHENTLHMLSGGRQCECAGDGKEAAGGSGQAGVERLLARPALGGGQHEDKVTVIISGYSKERIPLMAELVHAYAEMPFVHAVLVLWHNAADPLVGGSDPHNVSHLLTDTRSRRPPLSPFR